MILSHFLLRAAALSSPSAVYALTTRAGAATALSALTITNIDDVRGNLYLPTLDADSAPITWSSSDESVITADGIVTRPSQDVTIDLTATSTTNSSASRTFTASVRQAVAAAAYEGYAFAYFTGNTIKGENIFIAASTGNNALQWTELNNGEPILTSTMGTKGLRDPFIMRSVEGDTFYLLATDLSIGSGTSWSDAVTVGSRYLEIWESHDLVTWSAQRHVLVSPPEAGMTWAPEAFWDAASGSYVVYWASALFDEDDTEHTGKSDYHRMLISHTRDFVSFSEPTVWQDAKASRIDTDVLEANGVFYRFTKDEGGTGTGCSDIIMEESKNLTGTLDQWTILDSCIGRDAGTSAVEGPTAFKANAGDLSGEKYYLFVDGEWTSLSWLLGHSTGWPEPFHL